MSNELFRALDTDGGGSIDSNEWEEGLLNSEVLWNLMERANPIKAARSSFKLLTAERDQVTDSPLSADENGNGVESDVDECVHIEGTEFAVLAPRSI